MNSRDAVRTREAVERSANGSWPIGLEDVLQHVGVAALLLDEQGCVERATPCFETFLGENVVGKGLKGYLEPASVLPFHDALSRCLRDGECRDLDVVFRGQKGSLWAKVRFIPYLREKARKVFVVVQNRTEMRELQSARLLEGALHALYAHHVRDLIAVVNGDGDFVYVSPSFTTVLGYREESLRGQWFLAPIDSRDSERAKEAFLEALQHKRARRVDLRLRDRFGAARWFEVDFVPANVLPFDHGCVYFIGRDIGQRKRYEQYLERLAYQDPLTGLLNRRAVERDIARRIRQGERFAVGYLDLNEFKSINDGYGHDTGDRVLRAFVHEIRRRLPSTVVMARVGGDEFVLVIPEEFFEQIPQLANQCAVRVALEGGFEAEITACMGIARHPEDGTNAEALMRKADVALYVAKERSQPVCFYGALRLHPERLKAEFPQALERGELFLVYQPEVDLQAESVVGLEALVRWNHPDFGLLAPAEFLPMVEKAGFVVPLTRWVLAQALDDGKQLKEKDLAIAINVPPRLIEDGRILEIIADSGSEWPKGLRLEIEITEEALLADWQAAARVLAALQERGIAVVLDDFGSGYATLSYLLEMDLDKLKVDRLFLQDVPGDRRRHVILEQVLQMAERLQIQTIAEGVETRQQHEYLRQLGFQFGQGFYYSKPLRIDELRQKLTSVDNGGGGVKFYCLKAQTPGG